MALKKSELYSSIWSACDELRGGMDASQYKDYVLVLLFIKYVSDKKKYDRDTLVEVPDGSSFDDMLQLRGDPEIGDKINKQIIAPLAKANSLTGVIDQTDWNDEDKLGKGKEMVDRLSSLINIFNRDGLDFGKNRAEGDDLLGDAYEYLMRHFATQSGKSKGQFYTPAEVSRIMAKVINAEEATSNHQTVYDPTCGSGSLLLKVADEAKGEIKLSLYGQEKDYTTKGLAIMNTWMHGFETADIRQGNTLADPQFNEGDQLKRFDWVVANFPFSFKSWRNGFDPENDYYERFDGYGIPPSKNGDYAFLLHIVKSLKSTGKGAVILPHGVLFRGNVEGQIRKNLIKRGYIKGIIGLPANLFYGTGIPACIIVLDKEGAADRDCIFMIDASKGYEKDGNKNRLREQDIHRIVDTFRSVTEEEKYSRSVPISEIEDNDFNLNIPRYIDTQEEEDIHDIEAHLNGGVPARDVTDLNEYWEVYPNLKQTLFSNSVRDDYYEIEVDKDEIKSTIFHHPDFDEFQIRSQAIFKDWVSKHRERLESIDDTTKPKHLIQTIGDSLLKRYNQLRLVDPYTMYQHLMDYWSETMKDDVYMIIEEGWKADLKPVVTSKGKKKKGEFYSDLVPVDLVIDKFFSHERDEVDQLIQKQEDVETQMQELEEEHSGENGAMAEVSNKGEAQDALSDYIELAWREYDVEGYKQYEIGQKELEENEKSLEQMESDPRIDTLRNSRGTVTQNSLKERIQEDSCPPSETEFLQQYVDMDSNTRSLKRELNSMKSNVEEQIMEEINTSANLNRDFYQEIDVLQRYLSLYDDQSQLKKDIKKAETDLKSKAFGKYADLSADDVKSLVIDEKWLSTIKQRLSDELERVSHRLAARIQELADRYDVTLNDLDEEVSELEEKVADHLEKMGFEWK